MKPAYFDISLKDVRFTGRHGLFPQESVVGNEFIVNLTVTIEAPQGELTIVNTISYAELYDIVREEMAVPTPLLETVCTRIVGRICEACPTVISSEVEITKVAPPITGIDGSCAVRYRF